MPQVPMASSSLHGRRIVKGCPGNLGKLDILVPNVGYFSTVLADTFELTFERLAYARGSFIRVKHQLRPPRELALRARPAITASPCVLLYQ